jgi:hypothetical protein
MKKQLLFLVACFAIGFSRAQHLNYPDNKEGDIVMNEVQVTAQTNCTYWESMGWNNGSDGGGYCGIQYSSGKPIFIFAIWDPSNHQPIKGVYSYPNSTVESFGGEGTGLHYLDKGVTGGWKLNTWVRLVSRRWDYNNHSYFGYWSYDYGTKQWTHHITMDFPMANIRFNNYGTNSFLEDWCGSPQNYRKGLYGNGYKRDMNGAWIPFTTAKYTGNSAAASDAKANGGVENGAYFMEFGGNTTKTVTNGQTLTISIPSKPQLTIGQIASMDASYKKDSLLVSWTTDNSKSPQFSYTIKVINKSGTVMLTKTDRVPHLRKLAFNVSNLPTGTYTVRVSMLDIFDQPSNELDKEVIIDTPNGVGDDQTNILANLYPNPAKEYITLHLEQMVKHQLHISIYDLTGRILQKEIPVLSNDQRIAVYDLPEGIYFIRLFDDQGNNLRQFRLIRQKDL